jgi:hypothetical protein
MAELKIHIINPSSPLNWNSPRSLLWSALKNHLRNDYAPIGHFFVELEVKTANEHGVKHLLTGMSRANAKESEKIIREKKLGLAAFFYDFKGKLDAASVAVPEIADAKKKNRYQLIETKVTEEEAQAMLAFLADWIAKGSFRHYGGGVSLHRGEGSGCAEFAIHFLSLIKGEYACLPAWDRAVWIPKEFLGDGQKKISYLKLFLNGSKWASGPLDGVFYRVPDPELVTRWVHENQVKWGAEQVAVAGSSQVTFSANYPPETAVSIAEQWQRIRLP